MTVTQENRVAAITTPLGENVLLLRSCVVTEQLGRPFRYELELLSSDPKLDFSAIVGKSVTVRLDRGELDPRFFNGIVSRFAQTGTAGNYYGYAATVVPWFWLLTRTSDCRIFQEMTAPEIIKQVFQDRGFADFVDALKKTDYPKWEYCVQYRETDFNFISRLMEEEGIYYFFEHTEDKHHLVLADSPESHLAFPGSETMKYLSEQPSGFDHETILEWSVEQELQSGSYVLTDYDFKVPTKDLKSDHEVQRPNANSAFEMFDFPGAYEEGAEGKYYAQVRIEELQAQHEVAHARTDIRGARTGCTFKLENHPREDQLRDYLITSATYHIENDAFVAAGTDANVYDCEFTAIDAKTPFRAPRLTPKPIVQGPQTAVVVGPSGQEIFTDKFGRVKVHFHWDRHDKKNENSSCWIRVAQPWAGAKWGFIHIPRMGQEVIVEFLEGDPDRPIVTGRVYNADLMPPYDLPANMTQSGIKSRSTKGGADSNFNEIRMEDKKGEEELYFHAEKDQRIVVENDRNEVVGHDRSLSVGRDKSEEVGRNKTVEIAVNHTETIKGAMSITVAQTLTEMVGINYSETVGGAMEITVGAAMAITVGAVMSETVGGAKTQAIGGSSSEAVGGNKTVMIGGEVNETFSKSCSLTVAKDVTEEIAGQHKEQVKKDYILQAKKIQVTAEDEISLKTGSAEIVMKKNGDITIKGKKISVKGSGDVIIKGSKIAEN